MWDAIHTGSIAKCTITFCQFWSTLVSLESAFNAEQENDIIFAVTCTTEEIKIQMKPMTALVIQATVEADSDIHSASLVVMVYICIPKPSSVMCVSC